MQITDEIYGTYEFPDYFEDIINTSSVQRLKKIHQNGADFLVNSQRSATRYEHSIGVMILIKVLGGCEKAQISGLLHDISHTIFSHTIDHAVSNENEDYHELIKEDYLKNSEIVKLLDQIGFNPEEILNEENFSILEKSSPDLCADRLDYFFRDLYNTQRITKEKIFKILSNLVFQNDVIVCKNKESARVIVTKFIELIKDVFFDSDSEVINIIISEFIKKLIDIKFLSFEDFLKTDDEFFMKIKNSEYSDLFYKLINTINYEISKDKNSNGNCYNIKRKLRFVDPLLLGYDERISEIDLDIKMVLDEYLKTPKIMYYNIPVLTEIEKI
jgi:HD superfamily phosphohydrolase